MQHIHADGAYHSEDNQTYCQDEKMDLHLHGIQGKKGRYDLILNEEETEIVEIIDTETGASVDFELRTNKKGKRVWRISTAKGYRYFGDKELGIARVRKKIEDTPEEVLQKRNNVEATVFQMSYHERGGKTRYRGLEKQRMWSDMRALWVNFARIDRYLDNQLTQEAKMGYLTFFFCAKRLWKTILSFQNHFLLWKNLNLKNHGFTGRF